MAYTRYMSELKDKDNVVYGVMDEEARNRLDAIEETVMYSCYTAADVAAKEISVSGSFTLKAGVKVTVYFANANTADSPTLNIGSTGAKPIYHRGYQITAGVNKALLRSAVEFVYDGSYWQFVGNYVDTTNTAGVTSTSGVKMYPVGALSQLGAAGQTFTNPNVYIGTDNELYSNNVRVATQNDLASLAGNDIVALTVNALKASQSQWVTGLTVDQLIAK